MFAAQHGASNGNPLDDHPILFDSSEELLQDSLLTHDSAPKFDFTHSKGNTPFGGFDHLGIFEQYSESGPSSIHFGEHNGTSETGGSNTSTKDDGERVSTPIPPQHAKLEVGTNYRSQLPTPSNESESFPVIRENLLDTNLRHAMGADGRISPIQEQLLQDTSNVETQTTSDTIGSNLLQTPQKSAKNASSSSLSDIPWQNSPEQTKSWAPLDQRIRTPGSAKKADIDWRARFSIPANLPPWEFARQCFLAAYSSRLNPVALHPGEYKLLREHVTLAQVPIYLNIRNAILRLWTRNPLVSVRADEAVGCARESRYFNLATIAYQWLIRQGYINFGCLDLPNTAGSIPRVKAKGGKRRTIVVIGAGMSGLGCARQLEGLIAQFGQHWTDQGERPPKVIVLEGRGRIGGRVYSHPLRKQHQGTLPSGLRSTAEMGAQIVTGFEHGNPMNIIIRGQLALHTYALKDNSILYDHDGTIVDKKQDVMVESLYNDILERASVFRNLTQPPRTVEVDRLMMQQGKEPADEGSETISELESAGKLNTEAELQDQAKSQAPKQAAISTEKLTGRAYQIAGLGSRVPAAEAAKHMGWNLLNGTSNTTTINLQPPADAVNPGTLGDTMDEGLTQYQNILRLGPRDLRLYNWHHANLEYANSANVSQLSLTGWDQDLGNEFEGEHSEVIGGYSQVPRGLWQSPYPLDVRFRKKVIAINKDGGDLLSSKRHTIVCEDGETVEADQIVISTPLGVLKSRAINFSPPLPHWKSGAIARLGYGLLNKVNSAIS